MERTNIRGNRSRSRRGSSLLFNTMIAVLFVVASSPVGRAEARQDITDWPYRYMVSGPLAASVGEQVTYTVAYEQVLEDTQLFGQSFVFSWSKRASLVSFATISGPEASIVEFNEPESQNVGFSGPAPRGAVSFVLRISEDCGDLGVGVYVRGSGIRLPEGSVTEVITEVSPALPGTGSGADAAWPDNARPEVWLAAVLALAGAAFAGAGCCGLRGNRRNCQGTPRR